MVQDQELAKAVAAIPQRSERQQDLHKLVGAFVDVGIMAQVQNRNNQIIYGRRGTGKTHIFRVLGSNLESQANVVVYIDARTLGSTAQFADTSAPIATRCTALFRDILAEIHDKLLEHVVNVGGPEAEASLGDLDELGRVVTEPFTTKVPDKAATRTLQKSSEDSAANASISVGSNAQAKLGYDKTSLREVETERSVDYAVTSENKILFPAVAGHLRSILTRLASQLYILIDEWSSLPTDVQPLLAEFFKRAFLALPQVTVKIAALEHRSVFRAKRETGIVGFEMGADISAGIDIDDYYVFDRNPERITDAFGDMLVKHLRNELPPDYLDGKLSIRSGQEMASKLFTERAVFMELVRASEGVARDLINIFSTSYFAIHRKGREKIERGAVLEGARQWFEQDKEGNLDPGLRHVLRRITDEVIGSRRARSFLLPRELGDHPVIQKLFDLRVLHLVQRGYADKDKPGVRYNIYSLDYGTYVDLLNTSKKPDLGFAFHEGESQDEFVVPFDDKRSIRRIILTEDILREVSAVAN
jgi:hypothetical protein